jgi:16S rRNA (adenine(1408)-N(1))-methyltransferase
MEGIRGKHSYTLDAALLAERLAVYSEVLIDIGAGDGRYVRHAARTCPTQLAIGVDTCRENLRASSREAPGNALYIIADGRALPSELYGTATRVTINFPWGSLLAGLLDGDSGLLAGLAAVSRPGAAIELRLNAGALAEAGWALEAGARRIRDALYAGGFAVGHAAALDTCTLRAFPSTWARRLAFGRDPRALYLPARTTPAHDTMTR